jgi:hypothetical protein
MSLATEIMQGGMSAGAARAINGTVNSAVSGAGTTIADATQLKTGHAVVTTVAASSGVLLPNGEIGDEVFVYNGTATNALKVYPPTSSQTINQLSAGSAMLLAPYTGCKYKKATSTVWSAFLSA